MTIKIWLLVRLLLSLALIRVLGSALTGPFHALPLPLSLGVIGIRSHLTLLLVLLLLLLLIDHLMTTYCTFEKEKNTIRMMTFVFSA